MKRYHYDPVCGLKLRKEKAYRVIFGKDEQFLLCCPECQAQFEADRERFMQKARILEEKTNKRRV